MRTRMVNCPNSFTLGGSRALEQDRDTTPVSSGPKLWLILIPIRFQVGIYRRSELVSVHVHCTMYSALKRKYSRRSELVSVHVHCTVLLKENTVETMTIMVPGPFEMT
jgi:hypothetical protein